MTNKDLLHSTGNYTEYHIITYNVRESIKEYIYIYSYIYISESLCCTPETNNSANQLYFNKFFIKKLRPNPSPL